MAYRKFIVVAASMLALAQGNAFAQEASTDAAATDESGLGDIVVTANKREENLQRTAAAVTAVSGDLLVEKGVTDLRGVQALVPSARFQQEGQSTQVFLRGIGSNLDFANVEQVVSFNFNGVYIPREGTSAPFFDIERIEVLPGPQGTLYGRNAVGGTVNVGFVKPKQEAEFSGVLEAGNYDLWHGTAVVNVPISDTLAARLGVDYTHTSGYQTSGAEAKDDLAVRLGLLYDADKGFNIYFWGYVVDKDGTAPNLVNKGFDPATGAYSENAFLHDNPWDDTRTGTLAAFAPFGQPRAEDLDYRNYVAGAEINIALSDTTTFTYIPSYLDLKLDYGYWLGGIPAHYDVAYEQTTHELRLSGDTDRLKWIAGLYYYHMSVDQDVRVLPGTPFEGIFFNNDKGIKEGFAAFGQATYSASDTFRVMAGGRYSSDHAEATGTSFTLQPYNFDRKFKRFDFKLGAEADLGASTMAYLTYQTGYTPGTYNPFPATPGNDNLVKPAKLSSITAGLKNRFLDDRLQLNLEAYYYDYRDLYIQAFDQSKLFNPIFNAEKVEIYGVQADLKFKPTTADLLSLSVSYNHARNKDFTTPDGQNFNGLSPAYAADWTLAAEYSRDIDVGSSGYVRLQGDGRYESSFYADFIHNLGTRQKPYVKLNASVTYFANSGRWNLGAWIKNITDEPVIAATAFAGIPGPATAYLEPPRTYGVRLGFNF
ncbi:TonB-dependent receptor [Sphingopyxis lindanitolerans]|nr:TonB-dependent receptor [Sphingopyxis lindanitolerans]